jgi:hypothetical protein
MNVQTEINEGKIPLQVGHIVRNSESQEEYSVVGFAVSGSGLENGENATYAIFSNRDTGKSLAVVAKTMSVIVTSKVVQDAIVDLILPVTVQYFTECPNGVQMVICLKPGKTKFELFAYPAAEFSDHFKIMISE